MKMTMTSLNRFVQRALLAAGLLGAGCEEDVNYAYFDVTLKLDASAIPQYLDKVTSCGVNVTGADTDMATVDCRRGTHDLGTFNWSTDATGSVTFVVNVIDGIGRSIGKGMSDPVTIAPGSTKALEIKIVPDATANMP